MRHADALCVKRPWQCGRDRRRATIGGCLISERLATTRSAAIHDAPETEALTVGRVSDVRLLVGTRGGVITTATLRDATGWAELVDDLGLAGLVRQGLRHTALTWMADAGVELHLLQRVPGHQDPAVTSRYLHLDHQAVLDVGAWPPDERSPDQV